MRIIVTSDLHQLISKWADFVDVVGRERPRFVLVAGDLLPKEGGHSGQRDFFKKLKTYLLKMKDTTGVRPMMYFGNDDYHTLEPSLDELADEGLCLNLNGRIHREEGLVFCGMNKVRDYPFGYKHWCVPDDEFVACPVQFCGQGLTLDEHGDYVLLDNLVAHLKAKPSIRQELHTLKAQLQPGEMERSIWMVHQPPTELGMDICGTGERVGSPAVLEFARENQPLLGCSGHIHESPYQQGGRWMNRVGRTLWLQPGQLGPRLHYVRVELGDGGAVTECWHSVLSKAQSQDSRMPEP